MLPICRELCIALVPWSPLGGGFLTGTIKSLDKSDFRNNNPRFQAQNFSNNQERFEPLNKLAAELKVSPAQLALAWLLHQDPLVIPIPGTRRKNRLDENAKAAELIITSKILEKMNTLFPRGLAEGATLL